MTSQPPRSTFPAQRFHSLLPHGLGLLSMVGLLSTGAVLAQASSAVTEDVIPVESAEASPELPPVNLDISGSLAELETPATETYLPAPPETATNEPYIDTTNYSLGATERTLPAAPETYASQGSINPPAILSPALSSLGSSSVGSYSVTSIAGRSPASVQEFYHRTIRPPAMLGNGNIRLIFPLAIPAPITSVFGWRIHPISGDQRFHSGTDLGAPMGTPVLAAYAGRVAVADFLGGYGLAVALDHNKGTQQTLYAHLSEIFVKPGEQIKQGEVIGRVGSTGNSTGPHLHFEFRQLTTDGWVAMDPGNQLEYALAQLVQGLYVAQGKPITTPLPNVPKPGTALKFPIEGIVTAGLSGEIKAVLTVEPVPTGSVN